MPRGLKTWQTPRQRSSVDHPAVGLTHRPDQVQVFLTDNHLVLVLEYCPGGDLSELLPPNGLYEAKALWLFQQVRPAPAIAASLFTAKELSEGVPRSCRKYYSPQKLFKLAARLLCRWPLAAVLCLT